jgi:uncharacterized protein (DUF1501 family)
MTTRRDFLRLSACGAVGLAAFEKGLESFGLMAHSAQAAPANPYKALVCIFMFGGNDSNNMVVPMFPTSSQLPGYNAYASTRGGSLALPQASLLPITPQSLGLQFGLHPAMTGLQALFTSGQLAVVCNAGPLNQPTVKAQYLADAAYRPYQLFSHSDQQSVWMSPRADIKTNIGWGGLYADALVSLNTGSLFPASASIAGNNQFSKGVLSKPLSIAPAPTGLNRIFVLNGFSTSAADTARRTSMDTLRTFDTTIPLVKGASDVMQQAIDIGAALQVDPVVGTFPNTGIGNQLKQVAKIIKLNQTSLNVSRQVFFCSMGGFDTHQDQLAAHTTLYGQLSAAMTSFFGEMQSQGLQNAVTLFTQSDFGRTLAPSGSGTSVGSDHAWGSHHLVLGGAVRGGDFYGVALPSTNGGNGTVFPSLALGGAYDTDSRGRWVPTVSLEQYAATLGQWFGVLPAALNTIFPNLYRFPTYDLGFLV